MFGGVGDNNFVETQLDVLETEERLIGYVTRLNELKRRRGTVGPTEIHLPEISKDTAGTNQNDGENNKKALRKMGSHTNFISMRPKPDPFMEDLTRTKAILYHHDGYHNF